MKRKSKAPAPLYRYEVVSTPPAVERYRLTPLGENLLAQWRKNRELRLVAR
jgi:hypothetical protein